MQKNQNEPEKTGDKKPAVSTRSPQHQNHYRIGFKAALGKQPPGPQQTERRTTKQERMPSGSGMRQPIVDIQAIRSKQQKENARAIQRREPRQQGLGPSSHA